MYGVSRETTKIILAMLFPVFLVLVSRHSVYAQAPALPLHVNVGSDNPYMTATGIEYLPDQAWGAARGYGFIGGSAYRHSQATPIAGSQDAKLLEFQRHDWQAYHVGPLPPGAYIVVLSFAERRAQGPNQSVFTVDIEGKTVLTSLDLFATAGLDRAYRRAFAVHVDDGELSISAHGSIGQTQLAALSVHAAGQSPSPPGAPSALTATPSFDAVVLTWNEVAGPEIDGYHIYRSRSDADPFERITAEMAFGDGYVDKFSDQGSNGEPSAFQWQYYVTSVDVYGNESVASAIVSARPLDPRNAGLPVYELEISSENLAILENDVFTYDEAPASVLYEGRLYPAEVRFRGHVGRTYPKKSWKIIFRGESPIAPRDRMNLRSQYEDPALLRGELTSLIYTDAGIRPPESRYVLLFVNGEYAGVYNDFEQVDSHFLARTGRNPEASIYAAGWTTYGNWADPLESVEQYHAAYSKESNKGSGYGDLIAFVEAINYTSNAGIANLLARKLEVGRFVDYYASVVVAQNMDFTRHNVYLIHDLDVDRWEIIPWDPDYTWGIVDDFSQTLAHDMPIDMGTESSPDVFNGPNRLLTRLLQIPQYRAYYCSRLRSLLEKSFTEERLATAIDGLFAQIEEAGKGDWRKFGWEENDRFVAGPARIKEWSTQRRSYLNTGIVDYCDVPQTFLSVNEVMPENQSTLCDPDEAEGGNCHEPWFEIFNAGLEPASLYGRFLSIDPAESALFRIDQPIIVPPLGHVLFWADGEPEQGLNHTNFRLQPKNGVISLYDQDGATLLSSLAYELPPPGRSWGRTPDGAQVGDILTFASPGSRNRFAPTITLVEPNRQQAVKSEPIDVTAEIFGDSETAAVDLYYASGDENWQQIGMARTRYGRYQAAIPGQPAGTLLKYYITAQDSEGLTSRAPSSNAKEHYILAIGDRLPTVRISRFRADTASAYDDEDAGWIELHNYGDQAVDLSGMYLSNDAEDSRMSQISPNLVIGSHDYLIFVADGDPDAGSAHLDFRLKRQGGVVALFQRDADQNRLIDMHYYGDQLNDGQADACLHDAAIWVTPTTRSPDERPFAVCFSLFLPSVQ